MQRMKPKSPFSTGKVLFLPLEKIRPNPCQPRRNFDRQGLEELAESIARHGLLQPVTVRRQGGLFELVAGERRLRAARLAGLAELPCLVLEVDEAQSGLLALVENLQRRDLHYLEQAEGIARLIQGWGLSQEEAAARLGMSQSALANKLRLLRHSPAVREALAGSGLSERHARALLKLPEEAQRLEAIDLFAGQDMNVARAEAWIEARLAQAPKPRRPARKLVVKDVRLFLNSLDRHLETMRRSGIDADLDRQETEEAIVLTIRLPKAGR